jgi:D-serine deaminase-like pyridoxal phosphate-dependent protein
MDPSYRLRDSSALPSPALLVYPEKIRKNTALAVAIAGDPDRLWPHIKTHKTARIVALQQEAGIRQFKCATVAEAEMLAGCGVKAVLLAYQPVGPNVLRLVELCRRYADVSFMAILDDRGVAAELSEQFSRAGGKIEVLLDIDPGMGRTGVAPDEKAAEFYLELGRLKGIVPGGLHCFDGHNNQEDPAARMSAARECLAALDNLRDRVERKGGKVSRRILGGTSTFPCYAKLGNVELSPGTCFLQDWNSLKRYQDLPFQPAALLFSRVVSKPASGRVTVDAGSKAIATDPPAERGIVYSAEGFKPLFQSEEHWVFEVQDSQRFKVGDELYILPTHICPTFALHHGVQVVDASGNWVDTWPVTARDRKLSI